MTQVLSLAVPSTANKGSSRNIPCQNSISPQKDAFHRLDVSRRKNDRKIKKMDFGWNQIWGFGVVIVGIVCIFKKNIPVGIEGKAPSFLIKGKIAIALGILTIMLGLTVALEVPKHIEIDRCLDSGGMYNYNKSKCEYE